MKNSGKTKLFKEKYGPYALVAGGSNGLGAETALKALGKRPIIVPGGVNEPPAP
jgi:hypothetical protein